MKENNPFKFGSVVDGPFFTNRKEELLELKGLLNSKNHVILISPRRYGKTSLIMKVVSKTDRPIIFLDLQLITDTKDFASELLKRIYRNYPFERIKSLLKSFRIIPNITINPLNNEVEVGFQPSTSTLPILEDVLGLIEKLGSKGKRPIVILDEFQDINRLENNLDRKLRSIIQHHQYINYAFLGSMESLMHEIFEKKKSAFYHFGQLLPLKKISEIDFKDYLVKGFKRKTSNPEILSAEILNFTNCHPYYTQQFAFSIWEKLDLKYKTQNIIEETIDRLILNHDMDYERLWLTQNQTDKKILIALSLGDHLELTESFIQKYSIKATSTVFSSIKRLIKLGYITKIEGRYENDNPFFNEWIKRKRKL